MKESPTTPRHNVVELEPPPLSAPLPRLRVDVGAGPSVALVHLSPDRDRHGGRFAWLGLGFGLLALPAPPTDSELLLQQLVVQQPEGLLEDLLEPGPFLVAHQSLHGLELVSRGTAHRQLHLEAVRGQRLHALPALRRRWHWRRHWRPCVIG